MDMSAASTKRSASQGSLNNTFKQQGRALPRNPTAHRPLRSVNENMALLSSPGPLQSMLKTTTETGDIGVFSMGSSPAAASFGHSMYKTSRPRPSLDRTRTPSRPSSRGSQGTHRRDDRRRLPSYRDTTSEILSMYGSGTDSQPSSCLSSLSPPADENGQRSYSMTTCSSRPLLSYKSSVTLNDNSGTCSTQRPRSPFPYPTRLKRPGTQPSSPALTENGRIDYSRMVEIDRLSYRTFQGSQRPMNPHCHRRPPPLSLRNECHRSNQPTIPLSTSAPQGRGRSRSSQSHGRWNNRGDHSCLSSGDYSARSSSLTSIVELYRRPGLPYEPPPPLAPGASFYYDYTEGFDSCAPQVPPVHTPGPPLAPIPQRASSFNRPLVLRDETQARLDAVVDISVKDLSDSSVRDENHQDGTLEIYCGGNLEYEAESMRSISRYETPALEPGETGNCPSVTDRAAHADQEQPSQPPLFDSQNERILGNATSDHLPSTLLTHTQGSHPTPSQESVPAPPPTQSLWTVPVEEARHQTKEQESETDTTGPDSTRPTSRQSIAPETPSKRVTSYKRLTALLRASLHNSLDPGLSDLAALVSSFDRVARSSFVKKDDDVSGILEKDLIAVLSSCQGENEAKEDILSIGRPSVDCKQESPAHCHSKNRLAPQINAAGITFANGEILSPQPISPARQLRVRNSIPKIEKALPPTPDNRARPGLWTVDSLTEDNFSLSFSPFHLSDLSTPKTSRHVASTSKTNTDEQDGNTPSPVRKKRFLFKLSPSMRSHASQRPHAVPNYGAEQDQLTRSILHSGPKEMLKGIATTKLSRRGPKPSAAEVVTLGADQDTETNEGTVRRRVGTTKRQAPSILATGTPGDLFTPPQSAKTADSKTTRHVAFDYQDTLASQPRPQKVSVTAPKSPSCHGAKITTRLSISTEDAFEEENVELAHSYDQIATAATEQGSQASRTDFEYRCKQRQHQISQKL
ncbi:uncharacterized protein VDAG_03046 [Verticillium dahliae VdLs.17]|uniref:Uncharacterized protein n=1 Tax=Verticillium dahliae (strain VdLs.17 / ATCC MYA-4575 / FGSC 10137) TaxID=498257 RepID=G2X023_VERDV|nr:uncharacterized protein VDAG_03046 [Verticillium dahliae VdLs.17]EGY21606.1 hypothetical protein VDAG_03046 [Verticillium dahliae VdLs.17]